MQLREVQEARTWALSEFAPDGGECFVQGRCDGLEALRQAVFLLLQTERGRWPIFSAGFGVDLLGLVGQPAAYVIPEAERRLLVFLPDYISQEEAAQDSILFFELS